jgi:MoaA/NifB/PqqE/SkfB family radical SAM enzyme
MKSTASFLCRLAAANFKRPGFPIRLGYAVTYRCNLKCDICYIWKKQEQGGELSVEDNDSFFRKADKFLWISITGGEPFLREDLPELVGSILRHSTVLNSLHFATNGTLGSAIKNLIRIIRMKNNRIKLFFSISIDGPPALHDAIRDRQGVWEEAVRVFKELKLERNVYPRINFTLCQNNLNKFEDTWLSLRSAYPALRFDDITVNIFHRSEFYYSNVNVNKPDEDGLCNAIRRILQMDNEKITLNNFLRRRYLGLYLQFREGKTAKFSCSALSTGCFLDPSGNLYPCVVYNRKLLNVKDMVDTFSHAWQSEIVSRARQSCRSGLCGWCWLPCDAYLTMGSHLERIGSYGTGKHT